jgi:hypothetical protein
MAFKMKGHTLPGINQKMDKSSKPDGRAKSSAFQKDGAPFLGAVMGAVGKVKGVVDKVKKVKGTIDKVKDVTSKIPGFKKHGEPEKSGAPMTDKPKHQKGGSYTYKGKTYPDFAHLPDAAKQQIYAKNAPNQELAKKVYGIKDENRDKEVAKKPGAPAIWPFKKKVKTSGAVLDRERKKKARGKKIKTSNNKLRNAFNKTTKKISDKIQEPGKKGNRPGFD